MTITTQANKVVAQGNGATTVWPFTFLVPDASFLTVSIVETVSGTETVIPAANFTVTGIGSDSGGSVTYPLSGSPIPAATKIVIERTVPLLQQTDLTNQGGAYPADIEDSLDYLTMIAQQLQNGLDLSLQLPNDLVGPHQITPPVAGQWLRWNASADGIESAAVITPSGSFSIATQSEAEAGALNTVLMTPLRSTQQTAFNIVNQAAAEAGVNNTGLMTPLRTKQAITAGTITFATVAAYSAATISLADGATIYITNYYATDLGGGHWCKIRSTIPAHGAYHTSANGKYAELYESKPSFRMFGALPAFAVADCTPYWDMWLDYCEANAALNISTLDVETGNWGFITRPRPIFVQSNPWGRTIRGAGAQNTSFYTNFTAADYYGVIHLLPNANGGGLVVKDLQIISQRVDSLNGCGIAATCGYINTLTVGGIIATGDVLTITIAGTAVNYTVLVGDTKRKIADGIAAAIAANATIFTTGMHMPVACNDKVVLLSRTSVTPTITTSSTGTTTVTRVAVGAQDAGYIYLQNLIVTSASGWNYAMRLDGMRFDTFGLRTVRVTDCTFFGGANKSVSLVGVSGVNFTGSTTVLAGGASGTFHVSGIATMISSSVSFFSGGMEAVELDFVTKLVINVGVINSTVLNTANTSRAKILAGQIIGAAQANWINSAYL